MTYTAIPDAEIQPGKPLTTSLIQRLRDNPIGMFAGDAGAPVLNRTAIGAGSSGVDGPWIDSTTVTGMGFWEPSSITLTAAGLVLPPVSILRVNGDVNIAAGAVLSVDTIDAAEKLQAGLLGMILGTDGLNGSDSQSWGSGGGSAGQGGDGFGAGTGISAGQPVAGMERFWYAFRGIVGGLSGSNSTESEGKNEGGGVLILIIDGDLTMGAGAKITANGLPGTFNTNKGRGGSGAGTVIVVCTGTIAGGTFEAKGGTGDNGVNTPNGGGGGGGYVATVASAYTGVQSYSVVGGTSADGHANGAGTDGTSEQTTMTVAQIRALLLRSYR